MRFITSTSRFAAIAAIALSIGACGSGSSDPVVAPPPPPPPGPPVRQSNTSCLAVEQPVAAGSYQLTNTQPDMPFMRAITKIVQAPNQPDRWYLLSEGGRLAMFDADAPDKLVDFLLFREPVTAPGAGGFGQALGMVFHPNYPATPEVFVYYVGDNEGELKSVIERVTLDDLDKPVNPTRDVIFTLGQIGIDHKGGDIRFGSDGYLYLALGDGARGYAGQGELSQQLTNLYGTMIRIDVSAGGSGYTIPPENPFFGNPTCAAGETGQSCPEIIAWGLRNPFRWSFDASNRIWFGDVGAATYEEVSQLQVGGNYGWPCKEATHDFQPQFCSADDVLIPPVWEYPHEDGNVAVIGGFVYSGSLLPELQGRYVYADFLSGRIWALTEKPDGTYSNELLLDSDALIPTLEQGLDGEIYVGNRADGRVDRLEPQGAAAVDTIPQKLADTGCFDSASPTSVVSGVVPYDINTRFWSDGAEKERFLALPDGTAIDVNEEDDWNFPDRSVLIKNFRLDSKLIETRLLMKHAGGSWGGYTWEWNDAETEATRVVGGKIRAVAGQEWIYPSENQCTFCHTSAAGIALGPETAQMNKVVSYPAPINVTGNQIELLDELGYFTSPQPAADTLPAIVNAADSAADPGERARAWLHANCSNCHRPGGPTPSTMNWLHTADLSATNACDAVPGNSLGIDNARIIAPGDPARSVLITRISTRGENMMPPLGSNVIDNEGVALITDWITSLPNCN